jgi:hypothetical protein
MKNYMVAVVALSLAACAAQGKTERQVSFQEGKATLQEVVQALGEPNSRTVSETGGRTACYQYAGRTTAPESFIRIIGPSSQEADLTCCFRFTGEGVLAGTDAKVGQISTALIEAAKTDTQAPRTISCPPLMMKPDAIVHLPFWSGH